MMVRARIAAAVAAMCAGAACALDAPQWPPPAPVEARMRELQQVIVSRDSSAAQREAAREELSGLLKSPAGQVRGRTADERPPRPARASIDPYPSVLTPLTPPYPAPPPVPAGEVARIEVVVPPRPVVIPQSGAVAAPSGRFLVDPRTGNVLHEAGAGFIDPRTGQVVSR
jgi:hypothetical protein